MGRASANVTTQDRLNRYLAFALALARAREQELVSKSRGEKKPRPESRSELRVTYFIYLTLKAIIASFSFAKSAVSSLPLETAVLQRVCMSLRVFST